jgi:rhomboid protease GluP
LEEERCPPMIIELRRKDREYRLHYDDFEQQVREGRIESNAWVRIGAITGGEFRILGTLAFYEGIMEARSTALQRRLRYPPTPFATAVIVGFLLRIHLLGWSPYLDYWFQSSALNSAPEILELGEIYRLLSYGLLHAGIDHLLINLFFLAYASYHLEHLLGWRNVACLFVASVYFGGVFSMVFSPEIPSMGASGGVFGLMSASVLMGWKLQSELPPRLYRYFGWALVPYILFSIVTGLISTGVDNWGHLGGLLSGGLLALCLEPLWDRESQNRNSRIRLWFYAAIAVSMSLLYLARPWLGDLQTRRDSLGLEVGHPFLWREGWAFWGDHGWFSQLHGSGIASASIVHSRPIQAGEEAAFFLSQLESSASGIEVLSKAKVSLGAFPATSLRLRVQHSRMWYLLDAVVLVRGSIEHRLVIQMEEDSGWYHSVIADRLLKSVSLHKPLEFLEAKEAYADDPGDPAASIALADSLYRMGKPNDALDLYRDALSSQLHSVAAGVGILRTMSHYRMDGAEALAREALFLSLPDALIAQAAEIVALSGDLDGAEDALQIAYWEHPDSLPIRRTADRWGLTLEP